MRWEKAGKAYIQWKISAKLSSVEENVANLYIRQMEEHPAVFEEINETAERNITPPFPMRSREAMTLQ